MSFRSSAFSLRSSAIVSVSVTHLHKYRPQIARQVFGLNALPLNTYAETRLILGRGQSAVIADVTEEYTSPVDARMRDLGGAVFRRAKSDVREDGAWFNDSYPFYPYEYVPARDAFYW